MIWLVVLLAVPLSLWLFFLGRAYGHRQRYQRGYRDGYVDGGSGSLAQAASLNTIERNVTVLLPMSPAGELVGVGASGRTAPRQSRAARRRHSRGV